MMPPLEMMIYAPDMFTLEIPEPRAIKTALILLAIGNYLRSWGTFQTNIRKVTGQRVFSEGDFIPCFEANIQCGKCTVNSMACWQSVCIRASACLLQRLDYRHAGGLSRVCSE